MTLPTTRPASTASTSGRPRIPTSQAARPVQNASESVSIQITARTESWSETVASVSIRRSASGGRARSKYRDSRQAFASHSLRLVAAEL